MLWGRAVVTSAGEQGELLRLSTTSRVALLILCCIPLFNPSDSIANNQLCVHPLELRDSMMSRVHSVTEVRRAWLGTPTRAVGKFRENCSPRAGRLAPLVHLVNGSDSKTLTG